MPTDPQSRPPVLQAAVTAEGVVHLAIGGDLDVTAVAAVADDLAWLAEIRPTRLLIDMSGVRYLDCASARLLASLADFLPPGQRPVLSSVQPAVRRLLQLTGLAATFEWAD